MRRVEVFRGEDGWYYRTIGDNGEQVDVSEAHANRSDALEVAKKYAPEGADVVLVY